MTSFDYDDDFDTEHAGDERGELGVALFDVTLSSGEVVQVMTEQEQRWLTATKEKYLGENKFTAVTDLQDLDRLLVLELLVFRWSSHLSSGYDYEKNVIDDDLYRKQLKEQSDVILKLKQSLGLDKKTRDSVLNDGNFHNWFMDAKRRARIFGIHREKQLNTALGLVNELSGHLGAFDRSDEEERKKLGFISEKDLIAWVRESMLPRFREVDQHFIDNEQKMWKRDL
jgi:hypothetical protein